MKAQLGHVLGIRLLMSDHSTLDDIRKFGHDAFPFSISGPDHPAMASANAHVLLHVIALVSLSNSFRLLYAPSVISDFMAKLYGGHFTFLTVLG